MSQLREKTKNTLSWAADMLRNTPWPEVADGLRVYAQQVNQPCVVAVSGQMNAGKSTFINALIGEDLAKTGATETTATINFFRYGSPPDPGKPVRCCWTSGRETWESKAFLDSLQGNDLDTLRRASSILRVEFYLLHPTLKEITLVDTPGLGAVVDEHQDRTAQYMELARQLRAQHDAVTRDITGKADAVIFLVDAVGRAADKNFLKDFREVMGGMQANAFNALGVMAKVDLDEALLDRRHDLSAKIASQLSNELNTVLPVSAGLQRVLDDLLAEGKAKFRALKSFVQFCAPDDLDDLLRSQRLFDTLEIDNSPLSPGERKNLRGQMPWRVFVTIARTLQNEPDGAAEDRLKDYAGFDRLKATLDTHFFQRGQIIRCHRLITDAKKLVDNLLRKEIHSYRTQLQQKQARAAQLIRFVRLAAAANRDAENDAKSVAAELEQLINQCYCIQPFDRVIGNLEAVEVRLDEVSQYLMQCNWDFCTLQLLEKSVQRFQPDELSELRPLFGLYGLDIEDRVPDGKLEPSYLEKRQQHWRSCAFKFARNSPQREVAERAAEKYGEILYEKEFINDRRS